jgi:hypothetical protein
LPKTQKQRLWQQNIRSCPCLRENYKKLKQN